MQGVQQAEEDCCGGNKRVHRLGMHHVIVAYMGASTGEAVAKTGSGTSHNAVDATRTLYDFLYLFFSSSWEAYTVLHNCLLSLYVILLSSTTSFAL